MADFVGSHGWLSSAREGGSSYAWQVGHHQVSRRGWCWRRGGTRLRDEGVEADRSGRQPGPVGRYIQDLAGRPATATLNNNNIEDIVGTFPKADGSGTFQFGIRIRDNGDGPFDLVTLLTKQ